MYSYFSIKKAPEEIYDSFWISKRSATVGDILKIRYKVIYNGFNPIPYAEIQCKISRKLGGMTLPIEVAFFNPLSTVYIYKEFECKHRGIYKLGEVNVLISDIFNMFSREMKFNTKLDLVVYPRYFEISNMKLPATEFFGNISVSNSMYEDYTSISTIRDYRDGDNVKMIDWKSSAKHEDIMIKKNDLSANTKIFMFLNGYSLNYASDENGLCEELLIETSASIINYCLKRKIDTTMITNTIEREYVTGRELDRFDLFLDELTRFTINSSIKFGDFLDIECKKLTYSSTMILLSTVLDENLFSNLVKLKRRKIYIVLVLIKSLDSEVCDIEKEKINYLKDFGIDIYIIDDSKKISYILGGYN